MAVKNDVDLTLFKSKVKTYVDDIQEGKRKEKDCWVELALDAQDLFGPMVWLDKDCEAYKLVREAVGECFPMPDAPARDDKSEKANEKRTARKLAGTLISNSMSNMRVYGLRAAGIENPKSKRHLAKWATACLRTLADVIGESAAIGRVQQALIAAGGTMPKGKAVTKRARNLTPSAQAPAAKRSVRRIIKAEVAANAPDLASIGNAMVQANRIAA